MINPELRRNLWLEITPHRLLAMPLVLGLLFISAAALSKSPDMRTNLAWVGLAGFMLLCVVWGMRLAANSFLDELVNHTWDWQRLSTLGPWTMAWGKLLGATAFAWYGGILCLAMFLITAPVNVFGSPVRTVVLLILIALTCQACALALAVHMTRKDTQKKSSSIGFIAITLITFVGLSSGVTSFISNPSSVTIVSWYSLTLNGANFALATAILLVMWTLTGVYRTLCQTLAVRTVPIVWLGFIASAALYTAGFAVTYIDAHAVEVIVLHTWAWSMLLGYLMLFTEPVGPMVVKRVQRKLRLSQWRRAAEELPCWPVSLACALLCAIALTLSRQLESNTVLWTWTLAPLPVVFAFIRDAGLLMFFAAAAKPNRVVGSTFVYIAVLDWILPSILHALGADLAASLVLPSLAKGIAMQLLLALLQAGIVWWLAGRRIRERWAHV